MFANRFTALIDACALVGALKRDMLLTLAEAEFYRLRWSSQILDEVETAVGRILSEKGASTPDASAARARAAMTRAFQEADVGNFDSYLTTCAVLPDPKDAHVAAAALQTKASVIVTDNLKDFPVEIVGRWGLDVRSTDDFLADTIELDKGRAVAAIQRMRAKYKRPDLSPADLLRKMEASNLIETANLLRPYVDSL